MSDDDEDDKPEAVPSVLATRLWIQACRAGAGCAYCATARTPEARDAALADHVAWRHLAPEGGAVQ